MNKRKGTNGLLILLALGLIIMMLVMTSTGGDGTQSRKYSEIVGYFERGEVSDFTLNLKNGAIQLTLTEEASKALAEKEGAGAVQTGGGLGSLFGGQAPAETYVDGTRRQILYNLPAPALLVNKLDDYRAAYAEKNDGAEMTYDILPATETPFWVTMIPFILLSVVVMGAFYYFMYMQAGGGKAMNVGRAKVKDQAEDLVDQVKNAVNGAGGEPQAPADETTAEAPDAPEADSAPEEPKE